MSEEPTPPASVPTGVVGQWSNLSPSQLRDLAEYAETLAAYREQEARPDEEHAAADGESDERPECVPTGASVTVKNINDNRYRYWQWREGDKIKSKYIGPAESAE